MSREVLIDNTTFIVNSYSGADATETVEQILSRVIVQNAEAEFKNRPVISGTKSNNPQNLHYD